MIEPRLSQGELLSAYWPILVASFAASLIATPICRRLASRWGVTDQPDTFLKTHKKPIPYLGGVAIFIGWAAGIVLAMRMFGLDANPDAIEPTEPKMLGLMTVGILLAGLLTMLLGLADDLRFMRPMVKVAGNVAVAVLLLGCGLGDELVSVIGRLTHIELSNWLTLIYSVPITILLVVAACNATNLIDGMDGLCSGVLGIISLGMLIVAAHMHAYGGWAAPNILRVVICLAMLGAAMGFLPYNRNPATIFMGDAGSMLLGLNAAVMILLFVEGVFTPRWMLASVMAFGLPLADMFLTMARRWRAQKPLMQGDRSHFYDQLLDRGWSVRKVVLTSYLLAAFYSAAACACIVLRTRYLVLFYLGVFALTIGAIIKFRMVRVEPTDPDSRQD